MIIVSQDKKTILNFNNIQDVKIERYSTHEKGKFIYKIFGGNFEGYATEIGTYTTEERAKEVLIDIAQCYCNTKSYEFVSNMSDYSRDKVDCLNKLAEKAVAYKMPKE